MGSLREALALGFELSAYFFISYLTYAPAAQLLEWDQSIMLGALFFLSLLIWTIRAYVYLHKK